jgi:chromosome segregation ATPase
MEIQYFRGLRELYNAQVHGNGIYFALDTKEIIHNGLVFSGTIPTELLEVITKAEANRVSIEVLNGSGEGSIQKKISDAINEFASQISDNGAIDTFKELIEFAANNQGQIGNLLVEINNLKLENDDLELRLDTLEDSYDDLVTLIQDNTKAIETLATDVDEKINDAFSWKNVN